MSDYDVSSYEIMTSYLHSGAECELECQVLLENLKSYTFSVNTGRCKCYVLTFDQLRIADGEALITSEATTFHSKICTN